MGNKRPSVFRAAWTAGRLAGRRVLGRTVGARDLELGELLTGQLDEMKGLAMKVGQIVSYLDVPLPDQVQAQLARLQTGVRGLPPEAARAVIEDALGAEVEGRFDAFDWEPVAAASIGQVHRAWVEGRPVAVKVQYPDVAASLSGDLAAVGRISSLASLASAVDGRALVTELGARFAEECDYAREARAQRAFARAFDEDPDVVIPAVLPDRCAHTVLTTAWVDGDGFGALETAVSRAKDLPPDAREAVLRRRDAIAMTLVRFAYRSLLQLAAIQADPHPGNYIFPAGADRPGTVAFLDFGCVRALDVDMVEALRGVAAALRDGDQPAFREAVVALGVVGRPKKFDFDHFYGVMEHLHRPLLAPRFTFDPDYVREGYALNGPRSPNARTIAMPPAYIWVARLQWGLWSVLARLRAQGSFRGLLDDLLSGPVTPLHFDDAGKSGSLGASPLRDAV